jgi:hypothetical protein
MKKTLRKSDNFDTIVNALLKLIKEDLQKGKFHSNKYRIFQTEILGTIFDMFFIQCIDINKNLLVFHYKKSYELKSNPNYKIKKLENDVFVQVKNKREIPQNKKLSKKIKINNYFNICQEFSVDCIKKAFESLKNEKRKTYKKEQGVFDINDVFIPSFVYIEFVKEINALLKSAKNFDEDFYSNVLYKKEEIYKDMVNAKNTLNNYRGDLVKNNKGLDIYKEMVQKKYDLIISLYDKLIKKIETNLNSK